MTPSTPPAAPMPTDEVLATLRALQSHDLPAHGGRTLAYVYDSGLADADAVGLDALAMFASSNGLDPTGDELRPPRHGREPELLAPGCRQVAEEVLDVRLVARSLPAEDVGIEHDQLRHAASSYTARVSAAMRFHENCAARSRPRARSSSRRLDACSIPAAIAAGS